MTETPQPQDWWRAGASAAERDAGGVPAWVPRAETACARAEQLDAADAPCPAAEGEPELVFAPVVGPFVALAVDDVRACLHDIGADAVSQDFARSLRAVLCRLVARTLVRELDAARRAGRLIGADSSQRFQSFLRTAAGPAGLRALLRRYPVLARLLAVQSTDRAAALCELARRWAADRHAVVERLLGGCDPGALVGLDTSGDVHNKGRAACLLRFAGGALVAYKPRPTGVDRCFTDLIAQLGRQVGDPGLRGPRVLCADGYGWVEYIPELPCADDAGLARFYRRHGILLALLHVLRVTDAHCENVIAYGDLPVLIDVETMLHPSLALRPVAGSSDPARALLDDSVARTAMLPAVTLGDAGGLDLSGLGGDAGQLPAARLQFRDAGLDTMHAVRRPGRFAGSRNRPRVAGADQPAEPSAFRSEVASGFRLAYLALATQRDAWDSVLGRVGTDIARVVVRDTRTYVRLLDESTHPDVLCTDADRERTLRLLDRQTDADLAAELISAEVAQLSDGDVPVFLTRIDGRRLHTPDGQVVAWLPAAPIAGARAALGRLSADDLATQSWVLRACFATRAAVEHRAATSAAVGASVALGADRDGLLGLACAVGDQLAAAAADDGRRVSWLGLHSLDDRHWSVLPLGADLGAGYTGVALFLAYLARLTGSERYGQLALRAVADVPPLIAMLRREPEFAATVGAGGYQGAAGIAYALARIGTELDAPVLLAAAEDAVALIMAADDPTQQELSSGRAGAVLGLLAVHADTGDSTARYEAARLAGLLAADTAHRPPHPGVLHGTAGVALALARAGEQLGRPGLRAAALDLLRGAPTEPGWCGGQVGTLGVAAELGIGLPQHLDLFELVERTWCGDDWSMCHGLSGALETVAALADRGDPTSVELTRRLTGLVLGRAARSGWRCATPNGVPTPGLLRGLAGIGIGLLRLGFGARVPSVLSLQAGPVRSASTPLPVEQAATVR